MSENTEPLNAKVNNDVKNEVNKKTTTPIPILKLWNPTYRLLPFSPTPTIPSKQPLPRRPQCKTVSSVLVILEHLDKKDTVESRSDIKRDPSIQ